MWRNATDGFVYVSLPGGLLPGPYRILQRGKRHVVDSAPVRVLSKHSRCSRRQRQCLSQGRGRCATGAITLFLSFFRLCHNAAVDGQLLLFRLHLIAAIRLARIDE
jgi:hypothetical protein